MGGLRGTYSDPWLAITVDRRKEGGDSIEGECNNVIGGRLGGREGVYYYYRSYFNV